MKLYVEGGGQTNDLRTACRRGFRTFLENAGLVGRMPRIVACGSRDDAFESFCSAVKQGEPAMLLVDSEAPVSSQDPWQHLHSRDQWTPPAGTDPGLCHLMVECMESWFLTDRRALISYFGADFNENALPPASRQVETNCGSQVDFDLVL